MLQKFVGFGGNMVGVFLDGAKVLPSDVGLMLQAGTMRNRVLGACGFYFESGIDLADPVDSLGFLCINKVSGEVSVCSSPSAEVFWWFGVSSVSFDFGSLPPQVFFELVRAVDPGVSRIERERAAGAVNWSLVRSGVGRDVLWGDMEVFPDCLVPVSLENVGSLIGKPCFYRGFYGGSDGLLEGFVVGFEDGLCAVRGKKSGDLHWVDALVEVVNE